MQNKLSDSQNALTDLSPLFESFKLSFFLMQCLPCFLQFVSTAIAVPYKIIINTSTQYDIELLRGRLIPYIFAFGKSNAAIYYSPIESPKVTELRKWPLKIFSPPNEQSLFRSTYAEFRNSKSLRITKTGKAKFNSPLFLITTLKFSNELLSLLVTAIVV